MLKIFFAAFALLFYTEVLFAQNSWPEELILVPEKSNFIKTSTYQDVIDFIKAISKKSSDIHSFSMGKSPEGKDIPVVVLAHPKISSSAEAKASGKLVVYIQGNIHAGEVEGKEVLMMLTRDILLGGKKHLLDSLIILFAPIYNTDSNDKMERGRRPSQEDSPLEIGIRENSQGLDLNRDGIKMEATETIALMKNVIVPWDPQLFVDLHTTNGTWHAYSLTWAPSYHYAGERSTYDYTNKVMLHEITKNAYEKHGLFFGPYGDYLLREGWPAKNFYTYNHHPRYLVNQFGLRNRMAILSEAFAHERFYQRIFSTYAFVTEILDHANTNAATIARINKKAEASAIQNVIDNAGKVKKGVRFKMVVSDTIKNFRTYDYIAQHNDQEKAQYFRKGDIVTLNDVEYYAGFVPEIVSTVPKGYVIPKEFSNVAEHLRNLGIEVNVLKSSRAFEGEQFRITKTDKGTRKFEGHYMVRATGQYYPMRQKFSKGDYIVDLAQPLSNLAFYALEPQSDDGLVTWNFFDAYLEKKGIEKSPVAYPIFKYYK